MQRQLDKLSRRLQLMIGRCVLRAVSASGGRVTVGFDGLDEDSLDNAELAEPAFLTCVPLDGAEGLNLSIMGDGAHQVVFPLGDRRHRPRDLRQGESALFDHLQHRIEIRNDRIRIVSPDTIEIEAPSATINGEAIATVTHEVEVGSGSSAGRWPIVTGVGDGG